MGCIDEGEVRAVVSTYQTRDLRRISDQNARIADAAREYIAARRDYLDNCHAPSWSEAMIRMDAAWAALVDAVDPA